MHLVIMITTHSLKVISKPMAIPMQIQTLMAISKLTHYLTGLQMANHLTKAKSKHLVTQKPIQMMKETHLKRQTNLEICWHSVTDSMIRSKMVIHLMIQTMTVKLMLKAKPMQIQTLTVTPKQMRSMTGTPMLMVTPIMILTHLAK